MASAAKRLAANAPGDFFVDETCIDCGTCRWVAPASFDEACDSSRVHRQPESAAERARALKALVACPVGAIGTMEKHDLKAAREGFPEPIDGNVHHCGYHAAASFGATSYFIRRPQGNILVDSPRFAGPLVRRLEALGGVRWMFLTHEDDVADHRKFAAHFGCARIMHEADLSADTREVEMPLAGRAPIRLDEEVLLIPVPGHSAGSVCLLYRDRYLFTGDHLAWDSERGQLVAFRRYCRCGWDELRRSVARLGDFHFEWVLPGHGERCHFPEPQMQAELRRCVDWMAAGRAPAAEPALPS